MIVTETRVELYAHCRNPLCPGYGQEKVAGIVQETAYQYSDNGADMMRGHVERSIHDLRFEDEDSRPCRVCKQARELSETPRPSYQPLSGFDPMGLVNGGASAFDPTKVNTEADARIADLEAKLNRLIAASEKPETEEAA